MSVANWVALLQRQGKSAAEQLTEWAAVAMHGSAHEGSSLARPGRSVAVVAAAVAVVLADWARAWTMRTVAAVRMVMMCIVRFGRGFVGLQCVFLDCWKESFSLGVERQRQVEVESSHRRD